MSFSTSLVTFLKCFLFHQAFCSYQSCCAWLCQRVRGWQLKRGGALPLSQGMKWYDLRWPPLPQNAIALFSTRIFYIFSGDSNLNLKSRPLLGRDYPTQGLVPLGTSDPIVTFTTTEERAWQKHTWVPWRCIWESLTGIFFNCLLIFGKSNNAKLW